MPTLIERATKAAHKAAARFHPVSITVDGTSFDAVQLEPWEGESEAMPGMRKNEETSRFSILKFEATERPKHGAKFTANDGRKGAVEGIETGAAHYVLSVRAYKPR